MADQTKSLNERARAARCDVQSSICTLDVGDGLVPRSICVDVFLAHDYRSNCLDLLLDAGNSSARRMVLVDVLGQHNEQVGIDVQERSLNDSKMETA